MSEEKISKARKDYHCQYCGLIIPKGSRYVRLSIKPWDHPDNDGYALFKLHRRCNSYWWKVNTTDDLDSPYYDRAFHRDMARQRVGLPGIYWETAA